VSTTQISCLVVVASSMALASQPAQARSFRVSQVPNGGGFGCVLCHTGGNGGPRNTFGMAVEESLVDGNANWAAVYDLDPDNDGFTNGEELGDPDGTWVIGDPAPRIAPTNPNDPRSFPLPCGNGILEEPEQCDVGDLDGASCESLGFLSGELGCALDCRYDTSACDNCGNGFADGAEECDGDDLAESDCVTLGFGSGVLVCTPGCTLDASACSNCGNDLRDGSEQCDGADLDGQTCLTRGFDGGELTCSEDCELELDGCTGDPELVCGDGLRSGDEDCDADDLGGEDCGSLTGGQGQLGCTIDCQFDTAPCAPHEPDVGMDSGVDAGPDIAGPDTAEQPDVGAEADTTIEPPPSPSTDEGCQISSNTGPAPWVYLLYRGRFP
jgi:hypothetical protein